MFVNFSRKVSRLVIYLFALIGLVLVLGWLGLRLGLTKTGGVVDLNDRYFKETIGQIRQSGEPTSAQAIFNANCQKFSQLSYGWLSTPDWPVLKEAIIKDQAQIKQASAQAGLPARLMVAMLVGEQLRLYNSNREIYKQIFEPLKILGVQSQFSWGVMGLKEKTAKQVETNLKDQISVFYLGQDKANLLDFSTTNPDAERFARLTDSNNHYYSYLYTALYLKQLIVQWQKAGYNIDNRPEILATLFNLGFDKSIPKADPQVGGAEIEIGGQTYSFGSLAYQFYYSGELIKEFNWQ